MPGSSRTISPTASFDLRFRGPAGDYPLAVVRSGQARRMRIAVDPRDGRVRLTLPARAALRPALAWAESKRGWIEAVLARIEPKAALVPGATLPIDDEPLLLAARSDAPRSIRREGAVLVVGGPIEGFERRVLTWAKREALRVLDAETRELAALAGVSIARVSVGDARTRWGSCSGSGDLRYSWRLVMAPPAVRRAVVAHEVAHRIHMHHGPAFHDTVARLLGHAPIAETRWLREQGGALHRIGRR